MAVAGACTMVAAVGGCGSGPDAVASPEWAAAAEAYVSAWRAAGAVGFTNAAPFWAADAHVDMLELHGFEGTGRPEILQNDRDSVQVPPRFADGHAWDPTDADSTEPAGPIYLSRERLVQVTYVPERERFSTDVSTVTSRGLVTTVGAVSISSAHAYGSVDPADLDILVDRYVEAWASGDPARVGDLYAEGAVLRDSIIGITATDTPAIATLAAATASQGGLPGAALGEYPGEGGRAFFIKGHFLCGNGLIDQLVLLLDVGPKSGCPGPMAVVLDLDERGRITVEERYHRIDALRRCLPADGRPTGWWDQARIPLTPGIRITGWASAPSHDIAIWNGDPRIDLIVDWARQRFAQAALPPPQPTSVTFMPPVDGDRWQAWGFLSGSDAPDLGLPFTADEACPDRPCRWSRQVRAEVLHEFAHLWLAPTSYSGRASYDLPWNSPARFRVFLAAHDLAWHEPDRPWAEQGAERAAETIAWGLMDQPYTVDARLGRLTCEQLATDFQTLTNSVPDPRACAEPMGGSLKHLGHRPPAGAWSVPTINASVSRSRAART